jgi:hypothetical protein
MVTGWFSSGWAGPQAFGEHSVDRRIWFAHRPQSPGSEISVLSAMTDACTVAPDPLRAMSGQVATTKKPVGYGHGRSTSNDLVWEDLTPADAGYACFGWIATPSLSVGTACPLRVISRHGALPIAELTEPTLTSKRKWYPAIWGVRA